MRNKKICATLLSLCLWVAVASIAFAASFQGKVVKVIDGDTVEVLHDGRAERIRLHGIDTPESGQPFGTKAKQFVLDIAALKQATVEVKDTDRYGRTVGEVFLPDGRSLNRQLVTEGYAWWYRQYSNDVSLGALEAEAKAAGRGLWKDPNPTPPWEWRHGAKNQQNNPSQEKAIAGLYHGNVSSHIFHQAACRYYDCKNCVQVFNGKDEAIRAGYRPCKICTP